MQVGSSISEILHGCEAPVSLNSARAGIVLSVLMTNSKSPGIISETPLGLTSRLMYANSHNSLSPSEGGENLPYPRPTDIPQSISLGVGIEVDLGCTCLGMNPCHWSLEI